MEDNPVGVALIALCGLFVFFSLMLGVVWSLPASGTMQEQVGEDGELSLDVPELADSEPIDRYAVITERPAFNPSRQPELVLDTDEAEEDELPEEDVDAPDVELAGVIITPSVRMVTLKQKDDSESLVAFEGQPLEGDYGSWHVSQIEPRKITLASGSGEEVQLSLVVHDIAMQPPAEPEKKGKDIAAEESGADKSSRDSDQPLTRAEEIRQRIAERREELRRAAEEESGEPADVAAEDRPSAYRSPIESMISARKKAQAEKENDQ
jgi:hypothetical protein